MQDKISNYPEISEGQNKEAILEEKLSFFLICLKIMNYIYQKINIYKITISISKINRKNHLKYSIKTGKHQRHRED